MEGWPESLGFAKGVMLRRMSLSCRLPTKYCTNESLLFAGNESTVGGNATVGQFLDGLVYTSRYQVTFAAPPSGMLSG